jgi:hypothetical protein
MAQKRAAQEVREEAAFKRQYGNIRMAVFPNQREDGGVWYIATISRRYRDGDEWKNATSYSRDELPNVALAANKAHEWMWEHSAAGRQQEDVDE